MAGDPTGTVFLAGKIQVGLESGNTQQHISNLIKSVKEEISVFNQSNKLLIDVDVQNATRISTLANNIRDIKSAIDSLSNVKVIWENMSTHMKSAFATANNLAVLAKDLPKVFEPLKESLNIGQVIRANIAEYADQLDRIKVNAGLLTTLKSKLPTALASSNVTSVVPGVVPVGTPGGTGAGSGNKAAQEYKETVERLHAALVNVFRDVKNLDRNEFWKKNKEVIIQSFNALQKYHEETGNVFAQGQDYVKLIQMINKEGIKPAKGLFEEKEYLQGIQLLRKNGIITETEYNGLVLKRQEALKKEQDASRNALSLRAEMLRDAKRESDQEIKNVEIQHRKTVEFERQKFAKEAKRLGNTGDIDDNRLAQAAIINRINNLRNSTDLADKREIVNLSKELDILMRQEVLLKNKISLTTRENELLAMMDRYLNGGTKEIKNQAGAELSKLKVSEKELLLKTAKNKLDSKHYDQLKKQLGYRRGITELFFDEMRNWPLMIARQAVYGAQWTLIFGTIHRVQAAIREGLRLYGEFERGTSRALRTGLTPTQLAGAFTPQANGGMKEAVTHYRELLNIQAMIFTSRHKVSVKEYMDVIYELTSANMSLSKAMQFADTTMKIAIAAEGDMTQTARTMAGLYNIYGKTIKGVGSEQEKFNQIANTVLVTWSREQIELTELNNALKYVAASGRAIDLDYRVLVTTIGHLNTQMIRGATAGTGLRQMMSQVSKDAGGLKNAFGDFTNDLIAFSKQEKMSFDPQKPMDFIAVMEVMRKKLLANRKDFVDYGQDIVFTQKELSEAYKIMSLRGANVGLTLLRTLPELKKKMQETLGLTKDFTDNFIKIQEMNIPVQWETMLKNLAMLPAAFLMGATHTESIAQAMANINSTMTNIIVGAFVVGKTISGWGDYLSVNNQKVDKFFELVNSGKVPFLPAGAGVLPDLYMKGKKAISDTKAEVNNPEKFMKDLGLRVDEFRKYLGLTTEAQGNAEKTLDMSSKKFMENLNQRIEAANTESLTWINIGDYIQGTADSLERYTQIYKELNGAYDIGQMGKVSGEFKKQQTYINALNKTMEGQIDFYNRLKESANYQKSQFGFIEAAAKQIEQRSAKMDTASIKDIANRRKALEEKDKYWKSYQEDPSKHLPNIQKEIQQRINAEDEYTQANRNILDERKRITEEYLHHGGGGKLWEKIQTNGILSEDDSFEAAESMGYSTSNLVKQRSRRANAYLGLNQHKTVVELLQEEKDRIIFERKKIADELIKPENQIPVEYIALTNDKVLLEKVKKEKENYSKAADGYAKATGEMQKGMYRQMMKNSYDNINELLSQSPRFQSMLSQVLNSEKHSDEVLQNIKSQMEQNVNKTIEVNKFFRNKLYKEIGMPGLNNEEKEKMKLKDDQDAILNMINAILRKKAQEKQNIRNSLDFTERFGIELGGDVNSKESNLQKEYYRKKLEASKNDYAAILQMRQQLLSQFGIESNQLQLKQQKEFNTLFMNEDTKKREGIKENYRQLMQQYEGDTQKQAQLQQQLNKELGELAVEQADKAIKEKQRVLDEIKKLKEEELKHAQTMAEQLLEIDKQKNLAMVKQAGLAEIEKLKASGKATPEAVKKIQERVDAATKAMTGKYDIKSEELKQTQAQQDISLKQDEFKDLRKKYDTEKKRFEEADKALKGLKTPPGETRKRSEWEIETPEYKRREEAKSNANDAVRQMQKLSEEIGQLNINIAESDTKIKDIKYQKEIDYLTETDLEKKKIMKNAEATYGIGSTSRSTPSSVYSGNLMTRYKEWKDWGNKGSFADYLKTLSEPAPVIQPSVRPGTGGEGAGTSIFSMGSGGGSSSISLINSVTKFNDKENPYMKEEISLERLKGLRQSRYDQLLKEFNLISKIADRQKFGADKELGSFAGVGKVPGAIGQSFARILANQVPVPQIGMDIFSKDKSLGQINAAIKAKEQGSVNPSSTEAIGTTINVNIGDTSSQAKLPPHIEDNLSKTGKDIVQYMENLGVLT